MGTWPRSSWRAAALLTALCLAQGAAAQPAPTASGSAASAPTPAAATVLVNVQQHYANTAQLSALFRHTVTDPATKTSTSADGSLWVTNGGQFRWDYMRRRGRRRVTVTRSLIHDGQTLWDIDHDARQLTRGTLLAGNAHAAALTFFTSGSTFGASFNLSLPTTTFGMKDDLVLQLTPQSSGSATLHVVVATSNSRVRESVVIHPNGVTESFRFFQQDTSKTAPSSSFRVNPAAMPTYTHRNAAPGTTIPTHGSGAGSAPAKP